MEAAIPAFNFIQIDKYNSELPVTYLCKNSDLQLKIITAVDGEKLILDCIPSGKDTPVTYLCEVQEGIPALSNEKKPYLRL
jgi:hypothetical protein